MTQLLSALKLGTRYRGQGGQKKLAASLQPLF